MATLEFSELSNRISKPEDDVWASHYRAVERQSAGDDVILLCVGDPDFATPDNITMQLLKSITAGRTHYSPAAGEDELRQEIATLESRETGLNLTMDQFVIFPGATAALYAVFACIVNQGDGVVVPEPMYVGYQPIMDALGADVQRVALDPRDFSLDTAALVERVDDRTKAILLNSPGNPCGNMIPAAQLTEIAEFAQANNLWLVSDEVYSLITFDARHESLLKCTQDYSNIAVVDGLSKSHAMSGWRVGWVAADAPLADRLAGYSSAAFFGCSQFVQDAASEALRSDDSRVQEMRAAYQARRDLVLARLSSVNDIRAIRPAAGMFVMLDVSAINPSGTQFAAELLDATGLSLLPGGGFGATARGMVRMSLTQPEPVLTDALDRLIAFCQSR